MAKHANCCCRPSNIVVGGYAWLSTEHLKFALGLSHKLAAKFVGPLWFTDAVMFNGKFPFPPSREAWEISLPGISHMGIPGNFPSHGKFLRYGKFPGILAREIPGREISQASQEGGNGNFPLNITALNHQNPLAPNINTHK